MILMTYIEIEMNVSVIITNCVNCSYMSCFDLHKASDMTSRLTILICFLHAELFAEKNYFIFCTCRNWDCTKLVCSVKRK
jgi:hypothetical protein